MASPALPPEARRVLDLARTGRGPAVEALRGMTVDAQVALVCETPVGRRAELLDLLPAPEQVVPLIPEAELCFTVKAVGVADAPWILEHATETQLVACLDLDVWRGTEPDREVLADWLDALSRAEPEVFLRGVRALDPELVVMFLKDRLQVVLKPEDAPGWEPPRGAQTLDGQFYWSALDEDDDVAPIATLLKVLFSEDYWTYFRMLQGVIHELDTENEEWALRWRTGRLEDLGFPPWDRAVSIYAHIRPQDRASLTEDGDPLDVTEWHLPVWMPSLPAGSDDRHSIFGAMARLGGEERRAALYAFLALANKVAVADRMDLADAESTPKAIEKAATFASAGLEHVGRERSLEPETVLRRVTLERLFSVGANLDPDAARPGAAGPGAVRRRRD